MAGSSSLCSVPLLRMFARRDQIVVSCTLGFGGDGRLSGEGIPGTFLSRTALSSAAGTSLTWLLSTCNVASPR